MRMSEKQKAFINLCELEEIKSERVEELDLLKEEYVQIVTVDAVNLNEIEIQNYVNEISSCIIQIKDKENNIYKINELIDKCWTDLS